MKVRYLGHSCFDMEISGKSVVFDPFITPNELAKDIDIETVKPRYLLLSHGHWDHVADAEVLAKKHNSTLVANWEIQAWFQQKGVEKLHPMNLGGGWNFGFGRVTLVKADHSSSLPDGTYGGNAGGFIVESEGRKFYYSGDTALFSDMKLFAEQYAPDFAFLPIGDNFTMGIADAVKAAEFLKVKKVIGMHFDTFGYIKIDHAAAIEAFQKTGVELVLMGIGETIEL